MNLPELHHRACRLTDDIIAIEQNVAFEKTLRTGQTVLGFKTYDDALTHQRSVRERREVIGELRRGIVAIPELEFMT